MDIINIFINVYASFIENISPCSRLQTPLKFIGYIVFIMKIIIPLVIIIFGMIDLFKAVTGGKDVEVSKTLKVLLFRLIAGVSIFFIPSIVSFIFSLVDGFSDVTKEFEICQKCVLDVFSCKKTNTETETSNKTEQSSNKNETNKGSSSSSNENNNTTNKNNNTTNKNNSTTNKNNNSSSKPKKTPKSKLKVNKNLVVLTVNFFNRSAITASVKTYGNVSDKLSWRSSNSKVATVNSNGEVLAKSPGTTYITVTTKDGVSAKTKVKVIDRMRKNSNNTWNISNKDYTNEEKESYLDNAEELCHSKWFNENPERYYYCKAQEYVYYTGSPNKNLTRKTMVKKVGVSATDYAIFISSAKETISLLKMNKNGKWKVLRTARTSTRPAYNDGHYRHDFYMGAWYVLNSFYGNVILQFSDVAYYKGDNRLPNTQIKEPHYAHRAIHRTPESESLLGIPRSAGCARVPIAFRDYLISTLKNQYGTRIIYF